MSPKQTILLLSISTAMLLSAVTLESSVIFDNISNYENSVSGASVTATASTPNTFMGDAYSFDAGTISITGFDVFPVNLSGTTFTGLRINISVWGSVNLSGTVNASTPAFGDLLGTYTFTESGTFSSGNFYPFEGSPVGSAPAFTLSSPLSLNSTTIGLSINYEGTTDGNTYGRVNSLTSLISYGTLPTVGSQLFNGYYRNAASEIDGNFTSTLRSLGQQDQSLAVRIYGEAVPEPATTALAAGVGLLAFAALRRGLVNRRQD
jgi:hypothetical protein